MVTYFICLIVGKIRYVQIHTTKKRFQKGQLVYGWCMTDNYAQVKVQVCEKIRRIYMYACTDEQRPHASGRTFCYPSCAYDSLVEVVPHNIPNVLDVAGL